MRIPLVFLFRRVKCQTVPVAERRVPLSLAGKGILICVTMNGETSDIELNFLV
jgi:hypothetical protein